MRAQVFELFYNFLVDSEAQQGASLYTLQGLLDSAANVSLLLLNGDVSYARHAPADPDLSWMYNLTLFTMPNGPLIQVKSWGTGLPDSRLKL